MVGKQKLIFAKNAKKRKKEPGGGCLSILVGRIGFSLTRHANSGDHDSKYVFTFVLGVILVEIWSFKFRKSEPFFFFTCMSEMVPIFEI